MILAAKAYFPAPGLTLRISPDSTKKNRSQFSPCRWSFSFFPNTLTSMRFTISEINEGGTRLNISHCWSKLLQDSASFFVMGDEANRKDILIISPSNFYQEVNLVNSNQSKSLRMYTTMSSVQSSDDPNWKDAVATRSNDPQSIQKFLFRWSW